MASAWAAKSPGDVVADALVAVTRGMELLGRAGVGRGVLTAVALDALRALHRQPSEDDAEPPSSSR